ncbi:DUF2165 family protein [uncultured Caulobacter sp.]|uniref:DUF2165 family protein n=1 Tax=uncultured Caulobacter sp. TaxID=158749 RepID=UPI00260BCA40|nr:DUF2165 domain-containing protein [uncultured Caulobacter sp.]
MLIRYCKAGLVAAMALLMALVTFNNIADYGANWDFVRHVLAMDSIFPHSTQLWRAIPWEPAQRLAYLLIIAAEGLSATLLTLGAARLLRRARDVEAFEAALGVPVAGLTAAMLLYGAGFVAIGGEWFLMWQSSTWGGTDAAARFFLLHAAVLVILLTGQGSAPRRDDKA